VCSSDLSAKSLLRVAPDNPSAKLALRKAEFESFKARAEAEITNKDYTLSLSWLDSALIRFPGHVRCLELKNLCHAAIGKTATAAAAPPLKPAAPSREILKQVQTLYNRAQADFNRGNLVQAIASWEEVERLVPGFNAVREYLLKAYRFVGIDLYGQNRLTEALEIWEKALKIAPDNAEIAAYARRTRGEIEKLKEVLGHTPAQVVGGVLLGTAIALTVWYLW